MDLEKVYEVEFIQYTNYDKDTISDGTNISSKHINIGKEPFLVKESDFEKYQKFGNGFRSIKFVGNIEI